jgi:hypothetical protein
MAKCSSCRTLIAWGGLYDGDFRYCSEGCLDAGRIDRVTQAVPRELLDRYLWAVYEGDCPQCGGPGPLDVYAAGHGVLQFRTVLGDRLPPISCRSCGTKAELRSALGRAALGWWLPFEFVLLPLALGRSVIRLVMRRNRSGPSAILERRVKIELAIRNGKRRRGGVPAAT